MDHKQHREYQIVISGVGGQGVLFMTRLLAEAAIKRNLPVFTSETHGMAQRGGTVVSHIKVGRFSSPLIRPGQAHGLIALKAEGLEQHGPYVMPGGWVAVNNNASLKSNLKKKLCGIDADKIAKRINDPKSLNLIMLGFTLSAYFDSHVKQRPLHCTHNDILTLLQGRLAKKAHLLHRATSALEAGLNPIVE
jgi:indolepyruvate ferredoxin oxidoreductase beta subunit